MKLSVSAYRAHSSAHKKILSSSYQSQLNYGSTAAVPSSAPTGFSIEPRENMKFLMQSPEIDHSENMSTSSDPSTSNQNNRTKDHELSNSSNSECKNQNQRKIESNMCEEEPDQFNFDWTKSNQRWMKLRTTVQISSAIQKKPPLKREDSFLKRFSTRQIPETQETVEDTGSESATGDHDKIYKRRRRYLQKRKTVVNPDENFYFYWLMLITTCVLYNLWTLIVRQSFPELQQAISKIWVLCDGIADIAFVLDLIIQLRTGYLEQGLMVYDDKKLAIHYMRSKDFFFDTVALMPLDLLQFKFGFQPLIRFPRFLKVYRSIRFYYIVESRTVWPNLWRVVNLIHILLILAHWFGCFYYLLSEAEGFQGDWVYPYRPGDYATLARKYLGSLYWSTLTLTTIGDLPTPETNAEPSNSADGPRPLPRRGIKSRLLQFDSNYGYVFTIVSYLIGVFIFATIVGQVGNVITNRNANRLEFERLLDGAKTYMRHHKVPGGMKRRVLRWYDYSWSRGRIQGGGDINTALGLLPDKLKTELALHVNLSVLKKVTIFQECQPEFLHDLVLKMKAYIFTPGDSICRKGEVAREMFIIADGILEVLSETGKVLTTMKAGDFFGEIGILNLDGLNKRTADVRSVGYSELFSLSREDVLAAMKDYPEAQEILQTLGRKRLMEVRFVNKKQAQLASEKIALESRNNNDNVNPNSASKKFVGKLKSDVKNIKGVLKKSRTNKRNETLEMKPLYGTSGNSSSTTTKNLLKRMPRVTSDENQYSVDEKIIEKEKSPSPIGAGLPLLQRLRLLKEKQDREEQASKTTTTHIISPIAARNLSPRHSIQEEPSDTRQKDVKHDIVDICNEKNPLPHVTLPTNLPGIGTKNLIVTQLNKNNTKQNTTDTLLQSSQKPVLKVSFREKILELQTKHKKSHIINNDQYIKNNIIPTISNVINEPSTELLPLNKNFIDEQHHSLKPWSKLKLATLISTGSYTSLTNCSTDDNNTKIIDNINENTIISNIDNNNENNIIEKNHNKGNLKFHNLRQNNEKNYQSICDLSPEYNGLPFVKKLKILNERQKLVELESLIQTRSFSLDHENSKNLSNITNSLYRSQSESSGIQNNNKIYTEFYDIDDIYNTVIEDKCLNSPLSPESNETQERRKLKSILKKLNQNRINVKQEQLRGLLTAHTLEGYVARHSKLLKSVTFNSTLSSPPNHNENPFEIIDENSSKKISSSSNCAATSHHDDDAINLSDKLSNQNITEESIRDKEGNQESFTEAINNIVVKHIQEMHKTFQNQLYIMESEVHKRDAIINKLQNKLKKNRSPDNSVISLLPSRSGTFENYSSDSSEDKYFMRDDSINTIKGSISSAFPIEYKEISNNSCKNLSILSPINRCSNIDGESYRRFSNDYQNELPLNFESNAIKSSSGIIVDIDESDSSNSTSGQSNLDDDDITNNTEIQKQNFRKHSNDWEVRMLAAELDRRERKRGQSVSENIADIKTSGPFLRRRRKFSDTETECSETDAEIYSRPRAVSLDQFNLGYRTDRIKLTKEKDRL